MKKLLLLLLFTSSIIFAQDLENSKWYFGNQAALDFDTPTSNPTDLDNSIMNTVEGCASVSDANGNLLFYTDGDRVWNSSHAEIEDGIGGHPSNTQSAVIVPHPGNCNLYYIFTSNGITGNSEGFYYSTIDMTSGLATVTSKKKSLYYQGRNGLTNLNSSGSEKITTYHDLTTNDIWIVLYHNSRILSFKVDENGVELGINDIAVYNAAALSTVFDQTGSMKISPNGVKLAIANGTGSTELYDFNSGLVTGGALLSGLPSAYGLEFSPNSNYLYSSNTSGINQLDISPTSTGGSTLISSGSFASLQLGINNKIYVAKLNSNSLGVINNPDSGSAVNFVSNGVSLGSNTSLKGLPQKVAKIDVLCNNDFITTWQVDAADTSITIPTHLSETYNYDVDWNGDGNYTDTGVDGDITHNYLASGTYTVHIRGDFPRIYFDGFDSSTVREMLNHEKIISIDQWGTQAWTSMEKAFKGCDNLILLAADTPDLSNVTDMSWMFYDASSFNQPINNWGVSNITNMSYMLNNLIFNQPLNNWNVSNVTNMSGMFSHDFNQPIENWDVSSVTNMSNMFGDDFNQPIGNWDVSNVTNMSGMFGGDFNQPIGNWDVSNVESMTSMFSGINGGFNQPIGNWDVSNVKSMNWMFMDANFNQPIGNWDVSSVEGMNQMFHKNTNFNQPIGNWDVSSVEGMSLMFNNATSFNQSLDNWDVSNVTYMLAMFQNATSFNHPLNSWDVSKVRSMSAMFKNATIFNQPLDNWDVSHVVWLASMFYSATDFNQPLNNWRPNDVIDTHSMFQNATSFNQPLDDWTLDSIITLKYMFMGAIIFDQPLGDWNVSNASFFDSMLDNTDLSTENYDDLLDGWSQQNLHTGAGLYFGAGNTTYCNSIARAIIDSYGWHITDGGLDPSCRISNNTGESAKDNVTIYPNPTTNSVEVSFKEDIEPYYGTIELSNTFGMLIKEQRYTSNEKITFDVSKQPKGIYILKFTSNTGEVTIKKIIKN